MTLGKHLEDPLVARAFFQFAMGRDLSKYAPGIGFQRSRPITDFHLEMRKQCIPPERLFLSAVANSEGSLLLVQTPALWLTL